MKFNINRQSGILLHPTALPGPYGIGEIGPDAYRFVDHLSDMGQKLWQILPIAPTDIHNSPYTSISTFAGNPLLISLDLLKEDNLLSSKFLEGYEEINSCKILFNDVIRFKMPLLREVSKNFHNNASSKMKISFEEFCVNHSYWLNDYSKYWALKQENSLKSWINWELKTVKNKEYLHEAKVIQFIFHNQWNRLHSYCQEKEIQIIGDMPIYVGYDSADVYFNRSLFQLDDEGKMEYQGGCPPCEYQKEGQLWRSPLYNWENHERTDFQWWQQRFKKLFEMVDIIRLDHFIGYTKYYRIPISNNTAHDGEWIKAPGDKLFQILKSNIKSFDVISEDLGDVTEDVIVLRDKHHFPGMRVLQFELDKIFSENIFSENSVVCTGTHDNDTLLGWFESLPEHSINEEILAKDRLLDFFQCTKDDIHWKIINYAQGRKGNTVIIPLQDILGENSSGRFNTPGTLSTDNWSWRMKEHKLTKSLKTKLFKLTQYHKRNNYVINNLSKEELEI